MDIFKTTFLVFITTFLELLTSGEEEFQLNALRAARRVRVGEILHFNDRQKRHALVEDNLQKLRSYFKPFHNRQRRFISEWEDWAHRATTESTTKPTTPSSPPPPPQTNPPTTTSTTTQTTTPAPTTKAPINWRDIFKNIKLPKFPIFKPPIIRLPWGRRSRR